MKYLNFHFFYRIVIKIPNSFKKRPTERKLKIELEFFYYLFQIKLFIEEFN